MNILSINNLALELVAEDLSDCLEPSRHRPKSLDSKQEALV